MRSRVLGGAALSVALLSGVLYAPAATAAPAVAAVGCVWQASALPLPAGTTTGTVSVTDDQGGYAGTAQGADGKRRVVAWKNGTTTDYGTGTVRTVVLGQNPAGTVIGVNPSGSTLPSSEGWRTRNGKMEPLPKPAGTYVSAPRAIKDNGDIIGWVWGNIDGVYQTIQVRWPGDQPDKFEALPALPQDGVLVGIDDDGTMLLNFNGSQGTYAVGLLRDGVTTYLPTVPGATRTIVRDISNGRVVGDVTRQDAAGKYYSDGVMWDRDRSLHLLPGTSSAESINRNGLIKASSDEGANYSYFNSIWRLWTFDSILGDADSDAYVVGDDETISGSQPIPNTTNTRPTVWRCGQ
ncbi:hypothetical protein [Streptosporangium sp. NBC_01756]|uniref:hypothetical protein n=1 Tax=Streptosporangium sp. NBC_01756 TaxID=2975950 RepID=UPI002DDAD98D|nr:hypothetical protein [Streptosporangium sp. NBC_01756]WSC88278.1 hypothetical protein OIE48_08870 [Streptosporangium sp. NBC_01756]